MPTYFKTSSSTVTGRPEDRSDRLRQARGDGSAVQTAADHRWRQLLLPLPGLQEVQADCR